MIVGWSECFTSERASEEVGGADLVARDRLRTSWLQNYDADRLLPSVVPDQVSGLDGQRDLLCRKSFAFATVQ